MLEELFGKRSLAVNPALLERQLETEITEPRRASHIVSHAAGIDALLMQNPMIEALLHDQIAPGIAGLFGSLRATLVRVSEEHTDAYSRENAKATLALVDQIVRLAQIPDPKAAALTAAGDDLDAATAITIDEILQEAGIVENESVPQEAGVSER